MKNESLVKRIEDDVIIFTDDKGVISTAKKVVKELKLNLFIAECTTDLYAFGFFFGIVDPEKLEVDYFENFKEIHENENPKEFAVLLTKIPRKKIPKSIKRYFIFPNEEGIDYQGLKLAILSKRRAIIRHQNSNKSYDKKLKRLFAILHMLQPEGSFVKLDDLCREFNVSPKTIYRDINLINEFGEDIQYDKARKGYSLGSSLNSTIGVRTF